MYPRTWKLSSEARRLLVVVVLGDSNMVGTLADQLNMLGWSALYHSHAPPERSQLTSVKGEEGEDMCYLRVIDAFN